VAIGATTVRAQDTTQARRDTLALRARAAADSARLDSVRAKSRADSVAAAARAAEQRRRAADTIKAPIAHAETPTSTSIGDPYQWDRTSLFASGALTLGELVDRIPGVTGFRSGWIGSPHVAAFMGEFRRVRVFFDGVEVDPLDRRLGGMLDLSFVEMWPLEDVRIEPAGDEVRVYLGSWRVRSTTPATRVDFTTGDLQTTSYRGYLGRRFEAGQALQLGAYQYSTLDVRNGGDVHNLSLWGRVGWAVKKWSVDASLLQTSRERLEQGRLGPRATLAKLNAVASTSYARLGYGDPDGGLWVQGIAAAGRFTVRNPDTLVVDTIPGPGGGGPKGSPLNPDTVLVSGDTTTSRPQLVLSGGWSGGGLRISATNRLRHVANAQQISPEVRASYDRHSLTLSAYAERSSTDSVLRADVSARAVPARNLAVSVGVGRAAPISGKAAPTTLVMRGELGVRLGGLWVTGGVLTRDTASLPAPVVFDTGFRSRAQGRTTGTFASIRGKFWRDLGLDVVGIRYGSAGDFLPQYQTRAQLYFESSFLGRFPSGNLHVVMAITHDYRSVAFFPLGDATELRSSQYRTWGALLEIRLLSATLTYQFRNFLNADYTQVPGFRMPAALNYYGIRWNFFN
jgi:hypothetical protein